MYNPYRQRLKTGRGARTPGSPRFLALNREPQAQQWALVALLVLLLALAVAVLPAAAEGVAFPDTLPLPDGFQPEGIAIGYGNDFFVGSIPTGAIYKGDLRTGEGDVFIQGQSGRAAIGLGFDRRSGYLFVAGGPTGQGYVYDSGTGSLLAQYQFTTAPSFINDVVVTREAAYFTDSFSTNLFKVSLGPGGELVDLQSFTTIPLGQGYDFVPGGFNANGIEATPNGKWLIIVNSTTGDLYRVDPDRGAVLQIDLNGGSVPFGDGLLLDGKTLYVVQNQLNQIAVVALDPSLTSGQVVDTLTSPLLQVPSTIDEHGSSLYAVNAQFGVPDNTFEVIQVPKH